MDASSAPFAGERTGRTDRRGSHDTPGVPILEIYFFLYSRIPVAAVYWRIKTPGAGWPGGAPMSAQANQALGNLPESRRRILEHVKRRGESAAEAIADDLG